MVKVKLRPRQIRLGDNQSEVRFYLVPAPKTARTFTLRDVATRIEDDTALTREDVAHTMRAFVHELIDKLRMGDQVKLDGLGTFYVSINSEPQQSADDLNVRQINKVNVRFRTDSSLRLVNNSLPGVTRGADNTIEFELVRSEGDAEYSPGDDGEGGGDIIDPDA